MIGGILRDLLSLFSGDIGGSRGMDDAKDQAETQAQQQKELIGALEDLTDSLQRIHGVPANIPGANFLQPAQQPHPQQSAATRMFQPVQQAFNSVVQLAKKTSPASTVQDLEQSGKGGKSTWFGGVMQSVGNKLSGFGSKLGGLGQTASKAVGGLSGLTKLAGVAGAALLATKALYEMAQAAYNFVTQQSENNRRLAMYSGKLSASFAQMDLGQMRRDMQMAANTSGTAADLNRARDEMENALQPIYEDLRSLRNMIGIGLAKLIKYSVTVGEFAYRAGPFLGPAGQVIDLLRTWLEWEERRRRAEGGFSPLEDWLNDNRNRPAGQPRAELPPLRRP